MKANASRIAVYVKHDIVFQIQPSILYLFPSLPSHFRVQTNEKYKNSGAEQRKV